MIRNPLTRFVSRDHFNREATDAEKVEQQKLQKKESSNNINDCVLLNHTECLYSGHLQHEHKLFRIDSQIAFFCGDSEACLSLGSEETHYVTVGVLELLEESLAVLECLL